MSLLHLYNIDNGKRARDVMTLRMSKMTLSREYQVFLQLFVELRGKPEHPCSDEIMRILVYGTQLLKQLYDYNYDGLAYFKCFLALLQDVLESKKIQKMTDNAGFVQSQSASFLKE